MEKILEVLLNGFTLKSQSTQWGYKLIRSSEVSNVFNVVLPEFDNDYHCAAFISEHKKELRFCKHSNGITFEKAISFEDIEPFEI